MRIRAIAATAAASIVVVTGCGGGGHHAADSAPPISVAGRMLLIDAGSAFASLGQSTCSGTGGYSDVTSGAEVVISDDAGKTLAITHLSDGNPGGPNDPAGRCHFTFTASVPAGKGFYSITVTHRGAVKFAEKDMTSPTVTLGS